MKTQDTSFFDSLITGGVAPAPHASQTQALDALGYDASAYADTAGNCSYHASRGVIRQFLQCVIRQTRSTLTPAAGGTGRRLLSSAPSGSGAAAVAEQHGGTYVVGSPISYTTPTPPPSPTPPPPPPPPANADAGGQSTLIIGAILAGVAFAIIATVTLLHFMRRV